MTQAPALTPVLHRRLKALTYLAIATGVAVILAVAAVWMRAASVEPEFARRLLFPELAAKADAVATISVETKGSAFTVTKTKEGRWILPGRAGYPADFAQVRKTVVALAELEAVARRTARADWHERLGLGLPKSGGSGTVVTLKDSQGAVLASLVSGQNVEGAGAGGKTAIYVRHVEDPQTYVALGTYKPEADQTHWLDKSFVELARDRIKSASVRPFKGPSYSVSRAKPEDEKFVIDAPLPRGRVLRTESEPNGVGNALIAVTFDDVVRADTLDFANAAQTVYTTFDGLTLTVRAIEKDRDFWVTLSAAAEPQAAAPSPQPAGATSAPLKPDVAKEAQELNAMTAGWAYKIPRFKGVLVTAALEDLLKPVGAPPPGP